MAKAAITILCPSGHRRKAQMTPNSNLLQVLEDMCNQESLDSSDWGIIHQRKKCDLTIPWRLSGIPTNALLEMYKLEERRASSNVTIQLQLPDNSRYTGSFQPTVTLQEMLDWYRIQPESMVAALDMSMKDGDNLCPVCSYMSEEIIGDYALSNTTLRQLGLTSGTAVIRYNHRPITSDELKKITDRIDDKIARRRQQQPPPPPQQQTTQPAPVSTFTPPPTTISNPSPPPPPLTNTTAPSLNNDEYSIFRDLPVSRPTTTTQQQPRTLADALGINISFEPPPVLLQRQQQSRNDFSNFKFPEASKGQDLFQNELSNDSRRTQDVKSCNRHTIAYDLSKISSTRENKDNNSEELPDSFFELTPDDLRSVLNSLRQQSTEASPLETRSMRERTQSARTVVYEHIAIRFVVNSNYILQGLFYPEESIANLIEFVRKNLICPQLGQSDFYLYTSPPRVVLSDINKSLSAYDLAPAAYVYLGHRKVSPLVIQLESNISIGSIEEANQLVTQYVFSRTRSMNADEKNESYNGKAPITTNAMNQPTKRNIPATVIDDKQLKDKLRKFLPGQK